MLTPELEERRLAFFKALYQAQNRLREVENLKAHVQTFISPHEATPEETQPVEKFFGKISSLRQRTAEIIGENNMKLFAADPELNRIYKPSDEDAKEDLYMASMQALFAAQKHLLGSVGPWSVFQFYIKGQPEEAVFSSFMTEFQHEALEVKVEIMKLIPHDYYDYLGINEPPGGF